MRNWENWDLLLGMVLFGVLAIAFIIVVAVLIAP